MSNLKIGDKVTMNNKYYVSDKNRGAIFTVRSEPFDLCGTECVLLENCSGGYATDGLRKVEAVKVNIYKDKRDESLTDEEEALVALSIDENYLLKSNLIDIHVLWVIRDALEKQIPKKPVKHNINTTWNYDCECGWRLISKINSEWIAGTKAWFCPKCGQAIDWEGEDE